MFGTVGAWSRLSIGFLVKVLSRWGSVFAIQRKRTSEVFCTSQSSSTTTIYLANIIWPIPQRPCMTLKACHGYCFLIETKTRLWNVPSAGSAMSTISGKFILKIGRKIRTLASPM